MASIRFDFRDFVIASGGTSGSCQLEDWPVLGLIVPTLSVSGTLTIAASYDGTTFYDIYDSTGTQVLVWAATAGNRCFATRDLSDLLGYKWFRVTLGAAQTADTTFRLIQRRPKTG